MEQRILAVDVQYVFGGKPLLEEIVLKRDIRVIEAVKGKESFVVKLLFKDGSMTIFEFANTFLVMTRICYDDPGQKGGP